MNQLDTGTFNTGIISNSLIQRATGLHMSNGANIQIPKDVTLLIGDYRIQSSELAAKLLLLDKLIAQYLPEELI